MTDHVKAFFLRQIDTTLEIAIGAVFLGAMAFAGWTTAGMI
jgi:hypothetical protein